MDKEFWKFIEFEGSGRPHQVMGWLKHSASSVSARPAQMLSQSLTKKQTECCLARAELSAGADRFSDTPESCSLARERPHQSSSWIEMSRFSVLNDIITNSEYPQTERWKRSKFLRLKWPVDVYRCEGAPMLIILMTFESKSHRFERKHKDKKVKTSPSNNNCRSGNLDFLWSNLRLDDCKQ